MHQVQIPLFRISERTTFGDFPEAAAAMAEQYQESTGNFVPLVIFELFKESRIPGSLIPASDAPDEIVVLAIERSVRQAVFRALERVEAREPAPATAATSNSLKFKLSTPLRSFFRQMTAMSMTVISLTFPDEGPDAATILFLRTPFTIGEFRREMSRPIE